MSKIVVDWPFANVPAEVEAFSGKDKDNFLFSDTSIYLINEPYAIAIAIDFAIKGNIYGGGYRQNSSRDVYISLQATNAANKMTIYGGGHNGDIGDVYLSLHSGNGGIIYGGGNRGNCGNITIDIASTFENAKSISLGGINGNKATGAKIIAHGENLFSKFTGSINGSFLKKSNGKKENGEFQFSQATMDHFKGKLLNFSLISVTDNSVVVLSDFNNTKQYSNLDKFSIDENSTLTFKSGKNYKRSLNISGLGSIIFSGGATHSIKVDGSGIDFTGKITVDDKTTLESQDDGFSKVSSINLGENSTLKLSRSGQKWGQKIVGGESSQILTTAKSTISGDMSAFLGKLVVSSSGLFTIASSSFNTEQDLHLAWQGNGGVISFSASPKESINLSTTGASGTLLLNGNKFTLNKNSASKLTVYGGGTSLVIDLDEKSNRLKTVYGGKNKAASGWGTSYSVTVKNGEIDTIYGGGIDTQESMFSRATSTLNLSGGKIKQVHGGSRAIEGTNKSGHVTINLSGSDVSGNVFGGGSADEPSKLTYAESVTINITAGTIKGNVYGGGYVAKYGYFNPNVYSVGATIVSGDVHITVDGNAQIGKNIKIAGYSVEEYSYINGSDNYIKFSKVGLDKDEELGTDQSRLLKYRGTLDGSYLTTANVYKNGEMIFSDYNGEFLGKLANFSNVKIMDNSTFSLNAANLGKFSGTKIYTIDSGSSFVISAGKNSTISKQFSGEGMVNFASSKVYTLSSKLSDFSGALEIAENGTLQISSAKVFEGAKDFTLVLNDKSKVTLKSSGTWQGTVKGSESSWFNLEKNMVFSGSLKDFKGKFLLSKKRIELGVNSSSWDNLQIDAANKDCIISIMAGNGIVTGSGQAATWFFNGRDVEFYNQGGLSTIYAGGGNLTIGEGNELQNVFAGVFEDKITNSANIVVSGGKIAALYGGGVGNKAAVDKVELHINSGSVSQIYGGGFINKSGLNNVNSLLISVGEADINQDIYLGGYAERGGNSTVVEGKIIFESGATFSRNVYAWGVAADSKSTANVRNSEVEFKDYQRQFAGKFEGFEVLTLSGDTELSFLQTQTGCSEINVVNFNIVGRDSDLCAMISVSEADNIDFTKAELHLAMDRTTLDLSSLGSEKSYILISGATFDNGQQINIEGLNSLPLHLSVGDTITVNDEKYALEMVDNSLTFLYTIGSIEQEKVEWPEEYYQEFAPLTAKIYSIENPISSEIYGYSDENDLNSLKVKFSSSTKENITVDTTGVTGKVWLNLADNGVGLSLVGSSSATGIRSAVYSSWKCVSVGDALINGDAYWYLGKGANISNFEAGSAVSGNTVITLAGGIFSQIGGANNSIIEVVETTELSANISDIAQVNVNSSLTLAGGIITNGGVWNIDKSGKLITALPAVAPEVEIETIPELNMDIEQLSGEGSWEHQNGTINLYLKKSGFTGNIQLAAGTINSFGVALDAGKITLDEETILNYLHVGESTISSSLSGKGILTLGGEKSFSAFTGDLSDFSGNISMLNSNAALFSGKIGSEFNVSGSLDNIIDISGTIENTTLKNLGTSVYLHNQTPIIADNSGVIVWGGSQENYEAKQHKISLTKNNLTGEEFNQFVVGSSSGSVGEGQTVTKWEDVKTDKSAVSLELSDFTNHISTLIGGSTGGKVNGDIYLNISSGKIDNFYAAGTGGELKGNVWVNISNDVTIGTLQIGSENLSFEGDSEVHISGSVGVTNGVFFTNYNGSGVLKLTASSSQKELGKAGTVFDGGLSLDSEAQLDRTLEFSNYKTDFASSILNFAKVRLTNSSNVKICGDEEQKLQAMDLELDSGTTLNIDNSGFKLSPLKDETMKISGAGTIVAAGDYELEGNLTGFTGTLRSSSSHTFELTAAVGETLNVGGTGTIRFNDLTCKNTVVHGAFSSGGNLELNGHSLTIGNGVYGTITGGFSGENQREINFALDKNITVEKGVTIGEGSGDVIANFSGKGELKISQKFSGGASDVSGKRTMNFTACEGKVETEFIQWDVLKLSGNSFVTLEANNQHNSGVETFIFDLSNRDTKYSKQAMLESNNIVAFNFAEAESFVAQVDLSDWKKSGSFTLLKTTGTAKFTENLYVSDGSEQMQLMLNSAVTWNNYQWNLGWNSETGSLSLSWQLA